MPKILSPPFKKLEIRLILQIFYIVSFVLILSISLTLCVMIERPASNRNRTHVLKKREANSMSVCYHSPYKTSLSHLQIRVHTTQYPWFHFAQAPQWFVFAFIINKIQMTCESYNLSIKNLFSHKHANSNLQVKIYFNSERSWHVNSNKINS